MNSREEIISRIRSRHIREAERPARYIPNSKQNDLVESFCERATAVNAEIRILENKNELPETIADWLRGKNLPAKIHVAPGMAFGELRGLMVNHEPPDADAAALTIAPCAIAETGTLVYPASEERPASWHFRPGFEIAVLNSRDILPYLEDVLARLKINGALAHTINLVSGPSRTGDIEQTLELGAHGPKALAILIIRE